MRLPIIVNRDLSIDEINAALNDLISHYGQQHENVILGFLTGGGEPCLHRNPRPSEDLTKFPPGTNLHDTLVFLVSCRIKEIIDPQPIKSD